MNLGYDQGSPVDVWSAAARPREGSRRSYENYRLKTERGREKNKMPRPSNLE